ncbi:hypothetical protein K502DRAFT_346237 [Neoconidiobolus thromboides FSU 785]|nr:hypothetical protein K502DRAFT_346237 [Neoconidiobolus thromboides FSU 785]
MSLAFRIFATIINLSVFAVLICNSFSYSDRHNTKFVRDSTNSIVLMILRFLFAMMTIFSEVFPLQSSYIKYNRLFMIPIGRAMFYFMFGVLCFGGNWWNITSLSVAGGLGVITLLTAFKKYKVSPYIKVEPVVHSIEAGEGNNN